MKKFLFGLVMCATVTAFAAGPVLIYNYKASFKRVNPVYTKISYSFNQYDGKSDMYTALFDTFGVASDSLNGYLVIPKCEDCGGDWSTFNFDADYEDLTSFLYVRRAGDKEFKAVWKLPVWLYAGMFNSGVGSRLYGHGDDLELSPTSLQKLKGAFLRFDTEVYGVLSAAETVEVGGVESTQTVPYGFLGLQNRVTEGCYSGWMEGTGFGSVSVVTSKTSTSIGFCGTDVEPGTSCIALNSISGSMIGSFYYSYLCDQIPIFDICDMFAPVDYAPISGTWSIKLNISLSTKANTGSGAEAVIKEKMKVDGFYQYLDEGCVIGTVE